MKSNSKFLRLLLREYRDNVTRLQMNKSITEEGDLDPPIDPPKDLEELVQGNKNPRCFIAIEVERSGSKKHMLGDIVNASALGFIGLIVAWDKDVLRHFLRILRYQVFLESVGKGKFKRTNVLVVTRDQMARIKGIMMPAS
jgi:hypothetical protein